MDYDDSNHLVQILKDLPRRELVRYPAEPHSVYVCISAPPDVPLCVPKKHGPFSIPDCMALVRAGKLDLSRTTFECDTLPEWFPLYSLLQLCEYDVQDAEDAA